MTFIPEQILHKEAFGALSVVEPKPAVTLRFNYSTHTLLYKDNSSNSGTFTVSSSFGVVDSGTNAAGNGEMASVRSASYTPGQGMICRFTAVFPEAGVANNTRTIGFGDGTDGFYFGFNGTAFGVSRERGGTHNWTAQSSWSEDVMDGTGPSGITLDTTKGNVYEIQFQWLGFGMIKYYIENPATGEFLLVHKIEYSNANTIPSILNPTLPLCMRSLNTGNTTAVTIKSPSMALLREGPETFNPVTFSEDNSKNISTTETAIITIRNKTTYQSLGNRITVRPMLVSLSSDGNKPVTITAYFNVTLGGTPAYTDIDTALSVVDFDIAGTTVSGGIKIGTFRLDKADSAIIDVSQFKFDMVPGSTITFTGLSSVANDIAAGIIWQELF